MWVSLYTLGKGNENVLLVKYKENATRKPVHLITTACHAENVEVQRGNRRVSNPVVIHRYNKHMGCVDSKDKSIYHVTCSRQTEKYWKKTVFNIMDMAFLNATFCVISAKHLKFDRLWTAPPVEKYIHDWNISRAIERLHV